VSKTDEAVRNAVEDALEYDPRVFSFNVVPKVSAGVVTLEGRVNNLEAKRAAEQDARNTVGVVDVRNRIRVKPVSVMTDAVVAQNVRQSLLLDPIVQHFDVTVHVRAGIAHLYGTVDSFFEKHHAEEIAYKTGGVIGVRNHIDVNLGEDFTRSPYIYPYWELSYPLNTRVFAYPTQPDGEIADEIEQELWWSPFVNEDDVKVEVENGVATLTGTVDSWREFNAAENNAIEGGAVRVVNKLKVE
jgi:osmotically-inducible protein OsmY